jgi:hypothetical protein
MHKKIKISFNSQLMKKLISNKRSFAIFSVAVLAIFTFGVGNNLLFSANTLNRNGIVATNSIVPPTPTAPSLNAITFEPAYRDDVGWYYGDTYHVSWGSVSNVDYYNLFMRKLPGSSSNNDWMVINTDAYGGYSIPGTSYDVGYFNYASNNLIGNRNYEFYVTACKQYPYPQYYPYLVCSKASNHQTVFVRWPPPSGLPHGPTGGYTNVSYEFGFSSLYPATNGGSAKFVIDWGDKTTSETDTVTFGIDGGDAGATHTWAKAGTYDIKFKAKDSSGLESDWSEKSTITIIEENTGSTDDTTDDNSTDDTTADTTADNSTDDTTADTTDDNSTDDTTDDTTDDNSTDDTTDDTTDDNSTDDTTDDTTDDNSTDDTTDDTADDTTDNVNSVDFEDAVKTSFTENPFPDTNIIDICGKAAVELHRRAVIDGFVDGTFRNSELVNRAQAAKILLLTKLGSVSDQTTSKISFKDISKDQWYTKFVFQAANLGIINGYPDGTFKPDNTVNTAEFLRMLTLTFSLETDLTYNYTDVKSTDWFAKYAGVAQKYDLFPEEFEDCEYNEANGHANDPNVLKPDRELTRADVVVAIYQYLKNR